MLDVWPAKKFQFVAGDLCLDFCNTVGGKRGVATREYLNAYIDLLSWSRQARLIDHAHAHALATAAIRRPGEAALVLARAVGLREAFYRIFVALLKNKLPSRNDLACLNSELARMLGRLRVTRVKAGNGFAWEWAPSPALDYPLGPLARSAADLLTTTHLVARLRQCCGDTCGWLFLDASKNHSRRWCDMRDCGNRAKVRRHRLKQSRPQTPKLQAQGKASK